MWTFGEALMPPPNEGEMQTNTISGHCSPTAFLGLQASALPQELALSRKESNREMIFLLMEV